MEENLDRALSAVLGADISRKEIASSPSSVIKTTGTSGLRASALMHYNRAKAYLREGNWAGYGKELEKLERVLNKMARTE